MPCYRGFQVGVGLRACRRPRQRVRVGVRATARTQQETAWNTVSIVENSEACEDHRHIVLRVGLTDTVGSLCDSYRVPGMYVQLRDEGVENEKPSFFAISCAPNIQGYFEFLVKETESTKWLCGKSTGGKVDVSPVMGKGFPMGELDLGTHPKIPTEELPRDVLLFATGSGIAPIRAALESPINGVFPQYRRSTKLFYGVRYPRRMAYMDRFKLWEGDGVQVIPTMSRPQEAEEEWQGETGYIQDVLKKQGVDNPKQTAALLCGVKGMTEEVKALLLDAGVPENRILFNF